MANLAAADLRGALDFVAEAGSFEDVEAFRLGILPGLRRLVPCDLVGYNEVEPGGGPALVITYPEPMRDFAGVELARLAHQHPLISVQMNGDSRTYKISDFLTTRQFQALDLYGELYRRIGAKDQIAFGLPGPAVIGIAMNRDRRSFSERDRALLDLLRPHLAQAHRRLREQRRAAALVAALERGLAARGAAVVRLGADGRIAEADATAFALLRSYFADGGGTKLPEAILAWLDRLRSAGTGRIEPPPLTVEAEQGCLAVSTSQIGDGESLLILEEKPAIVPERLLSLGLTRRQAEVLALLANDHGVAEIAAELVLSPSTVRKHLEHVYTSLGVHSRAEAVAAALAAHGSAPTRL